MDLNAQEFKTEFDNQSRLVIRVAMEESYHDALEQAQSELGAGSLNRVVSYIFVKAHRENGLRNFLNVESDASNVFAPPTGARRLTIRISDPAVINEIKYCVGKAKRPLPVIGYSVLRLALADFVTAQSENQGFAKEA